MRSRWLRRVTCYAGASAALRAAGAIPMSKLVECVPNVSEGRRRGIIEAIGDAVRGVAGVCLLDVDAGAAANRTVYTFVGPPDTVGEAAFRVAACCTRLIDMRTQSGTHPRLGALDVCPFVPLANTTMEECVELARAVGARIGRELDVPVYFYERAARHEGRRLLADVRAGEYEGLEARLVDARWAPDCGPAAFRPAFGACVVGARPVLVAFNVTLATDDVAKARTIAARVRERSATGRRLPAVRAIGWVIEEYARAQVSLNLVDVDRTPPHVAYEAVREEAAALGVGVEGSELIGLIPLDALLSAGRFYAARDARTNAHDGRPDTSDRASLIDAAIRGLGLARHRPFEPHRRVIELAVAEWTSRAPEQGG